MTRARFEMEEFVTDPFGTLTRARAAGPVVELSNATAGVMRYDRVRELLTDPRLRASFTGFLRTVGVSSGPFFEWMAISPLDHDGPEHLRWRAFMSRAFTPRSVERLRPFLRTAAHELIDAFAARGSCEFMAEFADAYPSLGLCELIGVPVADRDRFREWANTIGLGFSPFVAMHVERVNEALVQLIDYTTALAAARRIEPRDDLVTRIAHAAGEDGWTDAEAAGFIAGLVFAGHETTKNQLGWTIAVLAERHDLWDAVGAGTLSAADLVEEVLRHRSAVTGVGRAVAEPITVDGVRLEPGEPVFLSIWGADHDPAAYPSPDALRPGQSAETPHLAFGHGAHFCLGAALARAELQEALAALTERLGPPTLGEATWKLPFGINGPESLRIAFAARERAVSGSGG